MKDETAALDLSGGRWSVMSFQDKRQKDIQADRQNRCPHPDWR